MEDQKGYPALKFLAVKKGLKGRITGLKGQLYLKTMTAQGVLHSSDTALYQTRNPWHAQGILPRP
jgi:hypothetical protein